MGRIKQVIVIRTKYPDGKGGTVGLRTGKIAAQVAHASLKVFFDRKLTTPDPLMLAIPLSEEMNTWVEGTFDKIVLGVETEAELLRVLSEAQARGIPAALITDLGHTEFHGVPTNTTVAIGPADSEMIDVITGPNGLVKTKLL